VNDKEHRTPADRPNRDPTLLLAGRFVALRQSMGISERQASRLKVHPMLQQVQPVFGFIPFKMHGRFRRRNNF